MPLAHVAKIEDIVELKLPACGLVVVHRGGDVGAGEVEAISGVGVVEREGLACRSGRDGTDD